MLWRTPTSVQFGADEPIAHIAVMTTATERVIAALSSGVSHVSLLAIAQDAGMTTEWLQGVLTNLHPALHHPQQTVPWRIVIDGTGPTAETLTKMFLASGHVPGGTSPDVVVIIGHHVLRPAQTAVCLRRDITHLPIVFGDSLVRIGPLITPGDGPCLHCVYLENVATDPSWHILAAQLLGRKSLLETERTCGEVASLVSRLVDNAHRPAASLHWADRVHPNEGLHRGEAIVFEARTGRKTRVTFRQQPECACQALPQNVTLIENQHAESLARTTRATGVFLPE